MFVKRFRKFQTFYISAIFLCVSISNHAIAASVSVEDIIGGIEACRSGIRDIEVRYSITDENENRFYEKYGKMSVKNKVTNQLIMPVPIGKSRDKTYSRTYHFFKKGNKVAFQIFDVSTFDQSLSLSAKATFDGKVEKYVDITKLRGVVKRQEPQKFIKFRTVPTFLGIERSDITEYMKQSAVECRVIDEEIVDGDLIVELSIKRRKDPRIPDQSGTGFLPLEHTTEHLVKFNISKNFCPIKIEKYLQMDNLKTGENIRALAERTVVEGFIESNGLYYPKSIRQEEFDNDQHWPPGSSLPVISEPILITSAMVFAEKVELNSDLPDEVFDIEFPDGTRYYDDIAGVRMIVGADPETLAEYMLKGIEALPLDEYTPEEAMAILQKRKEGKLEEAEELRQKILRRKKDEKLVSNEVFMKSKPLPLNMTKEESESPMQLPLVGMEDKVVSYKLWRRPIVFIIMIFVCVFAGYIATQRIQKRRKLAGNE